MQIKEAISDQELVLRLKDGDHSAYTEIYRRFINPLFIHANNRLKDEDDAQDVIQELFTVLWTKRDTIQISSLSSYLYSAVRNRVLDVIAHRQMAARHQDTLPTFISSEGYITDYRARENQLAAIIQKEIDALPPKMREVFELSRKAQLTHAEIADKLGITEQSVRSHIKNALRILRVKLGLFLYLILLFSK
ncbi:RNA polymerase sigma-70 factor, ECF subfamily [Mucilaginibacter pineti]|uniref:RNA polymerase sigma-70 factor, ECF subfamily n=1 Tax=Mucilaginibacter pineti TaxID=1391627 RepID=A0A1G7GBC4_9SPHI|nr:RNA polymerase sigma-70 factor [Mucilaginibacter pineti]SDE85393.1 RNA polymerase sigma-70 factor, ECF subfamily [Mucilaginibacter pineti]